MAKRNRQVGQKKLDRWLAEGRGYGRLEEYKPWLNIQDVPSIGLATRIKGWKTGRPHHFLSQLELHYFYHLEYSEDVVDIRERFLLDLEETLAIADGLGIKHPAHPRTREAIPITTDFVLTIRQSIGTKEQARTVIYAKDLSVKRRAERLEIERMYWTERNVDWGIVTERDLIPALIKNLEWVHPVRDVSALQPLTAGAVSTVELKLREKLTSNVSLCVLTDELDYLLDLPEGSSLAVTGHLIANHRLPIDITQRVLPDKPLPLIGGEHAATTV